MLITRQRLKRLKFEPKPEKSWFHGDMVKLSESEVLRLHEHIEKTKAARKPRTKKPVVDE